MGEGLQDSIGQEKDSPWVPGEQQGTAQACQKQSVPWETGQQPSLHSSHRVSALQLGMVPPWGTSKHSVPLHGLGSCIREQKNTTSKCSATSHSSEL